MHKVLLTDVTEMRGGMVCVAGWSDLERRMLRPLDSGGQNWPARMASQHQFFPGNTVLFQSVGRGIRSEYPHATEDRVTVPGSMVFEAQTRPLRFPIVSEDGCFDSITALFGPALCFRIYQGRRYHTYIPAGTETRSLGCVEVAPRHLRFFEKHGDTRQLRMQLHEASGDYDLPVVAHDLKAWYRSGGVHKLTARLQGTSVQVRLGLSRPMASSGECFVMVNGVYPW